MPQSQFPNVFFEYLANRARGMRDADHRGDFSEPLPSISDLSKELGVSVASLREQLEVAKALGIVEVKPRTGMRLLDYSFKPAVHQSLFFAQALDRNYFWEFSDLRIHIEASYWKEAISQLTKEDHQKLRSLIAVAWNKLRGQPIEIPHAEHRQLHLIIYSRLGNPFVQGLLEAFWEMYEAVGLNLFADYHYLEQVWDYHQQMVDAICDGNDELGFQALVKHKDLLYQRSETKNLPVK